jgi:hypothetical protein
MTKTPAQREMTGPPHRVAGAGAASADELLTKRELASRLKKTPRCIELWMRRGYLPYFKIARSVYFRWTDVLTSLERFRFN